MNGNRFLIDTNIAIYLLAGDLKITEILDGAQLYFSFISELELLSFKTLTEEEIDIIKNFLDDITIIDINEKIKEYTVELRSNQKFKMPDAIIAATAKYLRIPLLTADKDFAKIKNQQIILYNL